MAMTPLVVVRSGGGVELIPDLVRSPFCSRGDTLSD
jgi:hypothetical protein